MTNFDLENLAEKMKIKYFNGVFMKDELPEKLLDRECGIVNLQNSDQLGSHWCCYYKSGDLKFYFDSYGDAKPPIQLVKFLGKDNLWYNKDRVQNYNDPPICGHLCLTVLKKLSDGCTFQNVLKEDLKKSNILNELLQRKF